MRIRLNKSGRQLHKSMVSLAIAAAYLAGAGHALAETPSAATGSAPVEANTGPAAAALSALPATPTPTAPAATPAPKTWADTVREERFKDSVDAFIASDREHAPEQGGILFVGSSTIRFWDTLAEQFSDLPIVRRGFGGSRMADCTRYVDALVTPHKPRMVVVYAGDNDLNEGATAKDVFNSFTEFSGKIRKKLPHTRIAYVSIKPSPSRPNIMAASREANDMIKAYTRMMPNMDYIDTFSPMLDAEGHPRRELFKSDDLHMNEKGYALWRSIIGPHMIQASDVPAPGTKPAAASKAAPTS